MEFYCGLKKTNKPLTTFTNTILGLAATTGDSVGAYILESRAETYPHPVPPDVKIMTCGADVQGDRIEVEVVGWGAGEESWNIDYQIFHGPTDDLRSPAYREFQAFLNESLHDIGRKILYLCRCYRFRVSYPVRL